MLYTNKKLGFSFELPDSWHIDAHVIPLTFSSNAGHIQVRVNDVLPQYSTPKSRELYLFEAGCVVVPGKSLGGETNTVAIKNEQKNEAIISTVRDGLMYNITYDNAENTAVEEAVECMLGSFKFPAPDRVSQTIREFYQDPSAVAVAAVLRSRSAEEARQRLAAAEMPASIERPDYTIHRVGTDTPSVHSGEASPSSSIAGLIIFFIALTVGLAIWFLR